jgi:hypothetical protein
MVRVGMVGVEAVINFDAGGAEGFGEFDPEAAVADERGVDVEEVAGGGGHARSIQLAAPAAVA